MLVIQTQRLHRRIHNLATQRRQPPGRHARIPVESDVRAGRMRVAEQPLERVPGVDPIR